MAPWRTYACLNCGTIYEEEFGDPDSGIPPCTRWEDVPDDWVCPQCSSDKRDFELVE